MHIDDWLTYLGDADPSDPDPPAQFADWLEEQGKPAHAEVIRQHLGRIRDEGLPTYGLRIDNPSTLFTVNPPNGIRSHVSGSRFGNVTVIRFLMPKGHQLNRISFVSSSLPEEAKNKLLKALEEETKDNFE